MIEIQPEQSRFKFVYCDIVHRCNMECANCYLPFRHYPDLNTDKVINFIKRFKVKTEFRFIGGEPTLHKDLAKIINEATKLGHRTAVVTNGLRIAHYHYLKELKDAGLKTVYLSMTGFDDDEVYAITDKLKCANKKMNALSHCLSLKLRLSIGCIVIKNLNEHVIDKIVNSLDTYNYRINTSFEFRNVGQVGRYMTKKIDNYKFEELKKIILDKFKANPKKHDIYEDSEYSYAVRHGKFRINITNWENVNMGFSDKTNEVRGRLTQNFQVAPFLEHIKENDGGY